MVLEVLDELLKVEDVVTEIVVMGDVVPIGLVVVVVVVFVVEVVELLVVEVVDVVVVVEVVVVDVVLPVAGDWIAPMYE